MGDSVRASHLLVKHGGSRSPASWRDPDGSKWIKAKTKAQALAELAAFRARIVAGEDFATLAKQFSDCGSASAGGDLGVFGRCVDNCVRGCACARASDAAARRSGAMQKPFEDATFALQVGQLSEGAWATRNLPCKPHASVLCERLQAPAACMAPRSAHHAQPIQVARCALLTRGVLHSGRHRFGGTHHRAHAVIAAGSRASEALAAHTATTAVTGNRRYALHLPWQASPACCIAAESAARQVSGPRGACDCSIRAAHSAVRARRRG
jgi:NIMA-interacting peptidyl-prolyl cis-trans isomerase 1